MQYCNVSNLHIICTTFYFSNTPIYCISDYQINISKIIILPIFRKKGRMICLHISEEACYYHVSSWYEDEGHLNLPQLESIAVLVFNGA